ncbi:P-loop containing nucleoside triphosphate hydrolase protein [Xylariaceae sp. FL0662B]|nr:P-loop containing nucleoside triphosphate hydrolase protein [Xylariaceae sp. FL0662B]
MMPSSQTPLFLRVTTQKGGNRLTLLVASTIIVVSIITALYLRQRHRNERRGCSRRHVVCNLLASLAALVCFALNIVLAVFSPKKYESAIVTINWGMIILLRLLYLLSPRRRARVHLTANLIALNVILFSVGPNYIYPLIRDGGKLGLTSFSSLELADLFFAVAAAILVPLITPFHHIIADDGSVPHPSKICSPITRWWTYGWVSAFITLAYQRRGDLNVEDLLPLSRSSQPHLWFEAFKKARLRTTSTSGALWKLFCPRLLVMASMMVLCGFAEFLGAVGLRNLLQYLQSSPEQALFQPWFSAVLFGASPVVRGLCMQTFEFFSTRSICYLKGMIIYTIYRKLLQQPPGCRPDLGQVTNHVAADIDKIATIRYTVMAGFMVPVEVAVASVLLYQTIGWSYVPGLLVIMITRIPISWYVSRYQGLSQSRVMAAIDSRVRRVSETINGLQTIKMLGRSLAFRRWIGEKRKTELEAIWKKLIVITISETISSAFVLVPLVMSLSIYTLGADMPLSPAVVFTVLSVFSTLKSMLSLAVLGTSTYAQATVSLKRVMSFLDEDTNFLLKDDWSSGFSNLDQAASNTLFGAENATIGLPSADGNVQPILRDVNLRLSQGRLNVITGKTGSGKSTLLKALLLELPLISGKIQIRSDPSEAISYAGQSPWLLRGTIRENIIFGSPFSAGRYHDVIRAVSLEEDLQNIPEGDLADVGEAGSSLSGGQRSRVALARALYAETETVVLDDVLASLDATTTNWIVEHCIFGSIMKGRTLVLVSDNSTCREAAQLVVEVQNGTVKTIISRMEQADFTSLPKTDDIQIAELEIVPELRVSAECGDSPQPTNLAPASKASETKADDLEATTIALNGRSIMLKYMRLFGSPYFLVMLCFVILAAHASDVASSLWLTVWSGESESAVAELERSRTVFYVVIYASLCICQLALATLSSLIFFRGGINASDTQHLKILGSVLGATFAWITNTPAGQIINRFSSDMFSLDNTVIVLLKQVVENYLLIGFRLVAVASMLPTFLLPTSIFLSMGLYTGRRYIYGSTASKKLYAASLSPLLTGISDAITGIEVIRAHRAEHALCNQFIQALERYLRGWETVSASQRWLAVRMDLCAGLISLSTAILALLSSSANPASVGFSLTSSTTLCTAHFTDVVYLSSLLEVEMTSFQRIEEYIHMVPQEPGVVAGTLPSRLPDDWPSHGHLKMQNLTAGYSLDGNPVLEDINLDVHPGKRIAIVGRTGGGKSSLVASILRLIPKFRGNVVLDGVDLDSIEAERLRQDISFIPQSPTLFDGPLRFNLDFTGAVPDADLRRVVMDVVGDRTETSSDWVLDRHIEANGQNLSQGERQLVALARALATNARIIIIDEATASLDEDYEQRIQKLLRVKLANKSLITIAHRLNTIVDFDEVLVMEQGHVVERGNPRSLIDSKQGAFWKLWKTVYSTY